MSADTHGRAYPWFRSPSDLPFFGALLDCAQSDNRARLRASDLQQCQKIAARTRQRTRIEGDTRPAGRCAITILSPRRPDTERPRKQRTETQRSKLMFRTKGRKR